MKQDLSERIYAYLEEWFETQQIAPSMREIGAACGEIPVSTVSYHLDSLEAQGRVLRDPYKSRTVRLAENEVHLDAISEEVYQFIVDYWQQANVAPSQDEIAKACHLSPSGVRLQLKRLERAGRIKRGKGHRQILMLADVQE